MKNICCVYVLGSSTKYFDKHLAKRHRITKETHVTNASGTASGS